MINFYFCRLVVIINIKIKDYKKDFKLNLDNIKNMLSDVEKQKLLIFVSFFNEDEAFVGDLNSINDKTFKLNDLKPSGIFSGLIISYEYNKIRIIELETDYLNSLELYIKR